MLLEVIANPAFDSTVLILGHKGFDKCLFPRWLFLPDFETGLLVLGLLGTDYDLYFILLIAVIY